MCCCGKLFRPAKELRRQRDLEENHTPPKSDPRPKTPPPPPSESDIASSAINSALRFPSPVRSPNREEPEVDPNPPTYEDVMTEGKRTRSPSSQAGEPSGSQQRKMNTFTKPTQDIPDNVTVFSEDPVMYTPPTTRAPTVLDDEDEASSVNDISSDEDVDSVIEGASRRLSESSRESRRRLSQESRESRRSERNKRKGEKAAKKAEKWAARATERGYVFEEGWAGPASAVKA